MASDKMPQMGEHVEVGLTPVNIGKKYRIEYETESGSHTRCYVSALSIVDAITSLTASEVDRIKKLTIERQP
jgi:hypothetical protein